jgi:prepilin-type N-terminal cleavage/methylation domain-containing protein
LVLAVSTTCRGFSLLELLGALAIGGLAAGAIVATLTRQQQFYRGATEIRSTREEVRDAIEVLSSDVRGMSAADTPFRADSALELFAAIGTSIACQVVGNEVGLPPSHPLGNTLTSFLTVPDTGDIAMFYVDSADAGTRWRQYRIGAIESRSVSSVCAPTSGFSDDAELGAAHRGFALTLISSIPSGVRVGTPVRFFRRARYSLYRASDGNWYLGYRRCNAFGVSACGTIQPISGPYRGYSSDPRATGLLFEYFDNGGGRLDASASATTLARIDITVRSQSQQRNSFSQGRQRISDSATVSVALRN